jgi:hypothetical protein
VRVTEEPVELQGVVQIPLVCRLANAMVCRKEAVQITHCFLVCHVDNLVTVVRKFTKTGLRPITGGLSLWPATASAPEMLLFYKLSCYGEKKKAKKDFHS